MLLVMQILSGNLTAGGNIDFADTGADTITIGDANDTTQYYR